MVGQLIPQTRARARRSDRISTTGAARVDPMAVADATRIGGASAADPARAAPAGPARRCPDSALAARPEQCAELRRLSQAHFVALEHYQQSVARDLHDGLGQALTLIKLSMESAALQLAAGVTTEAQQSLKRIAASVGAALEEVRRISMALRPSMIDDIGLVAALHWFCREMSALHGVTIEKTIEVDGRQIPGNLKLPIYRIVQEATGNALKHSGARRIHISLRSRHRELELRIEDDGCGFDPLHLPRRLDGGGMGLGNIKERALLSAGAFELRSAPGCGTAVRVSWPGVSTSAPGAHR
jgi:signal transduction histidine kinase